MSTRYVTLIILPLLLAAAGCGKPQAEQQGGGGWPTRAVVAIAEQQEAREEILLAASLQAPEQVTIISELPAEVIEILLEEGAPAEAGQVLARLDDTRTSARLQEAQARLRLAELNLDRSRRLLDTQAISQQEFDQAETEQLNAAAALQLAARDHTNTVIRAPFAGTTGEKKVSVGQVVQPGDVITTLVQSDPLDIVFDVPERYLPRLGLDMEIYFQSEAYGPSRPFTGRVTYIAPAVTEASRTIRVKARISNAESILKPGMFGKLSLVLETRAQAILIPESAVFSMGGSPMVATVSPDGKASFQPVVTGQRFKDRVEITEGLQPGTMVVIEGFQKMGPGSTVIAAPESEAYGVTPGPIGTPAETPQEETTQPDPEQETADEAG